MANLYANENMPLPVVERLRALGHDVLTSHEAGNANRRVPDEAVLQFAAAAGRAVITFNRKDFLRLHREAAIPHQGIIVCTADADFPALAQRIHDAMAATKALAGQVIRVNRP